MVINLSVERIALIDRALRYQYRHDKKLTDEQEKELEVAIADIREWTQFVIATGERR